MAEEDDVQDEPDEPCLRCGLPKDFWTHHVESGHKFRKLGVPIDERGPFRSAYRPESDA